MVSGVGMSLFFAPVANVVLSSVRRTEEGIASGANNAIRELGGVFGIAVLGAVFSARSSQAPCPSPPPIRPRLTGYPLQDVRTGSPGGAIAARSGDSRGLQALQRTSLSHLRHVDVLARVGGYMISSWGHA